MRVSTYPGTGVQFTEGLRPGDNTVAFRGVSLLCNSDPGAPDSVALIAQRIEMRIVTAAIERRGFHVVVGEEAAQRLHQVTGRPLVRAGSLTRGV
jgi:hypothetical protein